MANINLTALPTNTVPADADYVHMSQSGADKKGILSTLFNSYIGPKLNPIGTIREFNVSTNPATLLGFGTWTAFGTGRVTVAIDGTQTEFDTNGETGGVKTHALSVAELAAHNHGSNTGDESAHKHYLSNSTGSVAGVNSGNANTIWTQVGGSGVQLWYDSASSLTGAPSAAHKHSISSNGSGTAHQNLQPYIVVYRWVRTA